MIGVGLGVTVGRRVAVGVASGCGFGVHPASRLAAAILKKSRLEIPRERGLLLLSCSLFIALFYRPIDRIEETFGGLGQGLLQFLKEPLSSGPGPILG